MVNYEDSDRLLDQIDGMIHFHESRKEGERYLNRMRINNLRLDREDVDRQFYLRI